MNDERHPGPMWMTVDGFTDTASGCFVRHDRCMMIVLAMGAGATVAIIAMMVMLLLMLMVVVVQLVFLQLLLLLLLLQLPGFTSGNRWDE